MPGNRIRDYSRAMRAKRYDAHECWLEVASAKVRHPIDIAGLTLTKHYEYSCSPARTQVTSVFSWTKLQLPEQRIIVAMFGCPASTPLPTTDYATTNRPLI
eukprot:scaffold26757_cov34-Prasinocladus_malaysianus.AAC.2